MTVEYSTDDSYRTEVTADIVDEYTSNRCILLSENQLEY